MSAPAYAELQVTSHFSFLRGASSAEELFSAAAAMGIEALAVTDRNTLAGIVRAHEAAKEAGVRLIVGCRLDLVCGMSVLVYPTDRAAWSRLCRLLSLGKGRAGKARCHLEWDDLVAYDFLSETHGGWENNDGAYGEFSFDVAARTITLDYNERYTATEFYSHEF